MRALLLVIAIGCAEPAKPAAGPAAPAAPVAPPLEVVPPRQLTLEPADEGMTMEIRLRGILVGHARVAIGRAGVVGGRAAIEVRTHAETDGVIALIGEMSWDLTSTIDLETGATLATREREHEHLIGMHDRERDHERTYRVDEERRDDLHAAIGLLRANALSIAPGAQMTVDVAFGSATVPISVQLVGTDHLRRAATPSLHFRGTADEPRGMAFDLWLSDDNLRVPQRFHCATPVGDVDVELVDYRVGDQF